ncbi:mRNA interferase toxin RelE [Pantoea sp. Nvir]|uniref:type II toxin-antitoxin system RelE family toxin n=1 Tax=unclassified Pantoea TaxID=2630326 RepID=UPI001EF47BDA|nr:MULTISPECIES: type II toxin-antitoxin system RelE/ParE family toxin [unclassified Pantoea]MCG7366018.1 type II toxin-antitoxin system RelE/ParE family toxin [Pantoea sp. ACRSH]MCG7396646.1 type II toxin-antitoxin system RelE/ParE family toxin [Pantoea sp. ACRSC]
MTYRVEFKETALKEWKKLDPTIRGMFVKKLKKLQENPRVEKNKLREMSDCYKIKLRAAGYRLVYKVLDGVLVIEVIAVGIRERSSVYGAAKKRLE